MPAAAPSGGRSGGEDSPSSTGSTSGPGLSKRLRAAMRAGSKPRVLVRATGRLDADRDGKPELRSSDNERQLLGAGKAGVCSDLPRLRTKPGRAVATKLPVCGSSVSWRIVKRPEHGTARIRGDRLIYRPARKFRGSETIALAPRQRGASSSAETEPQTALQVTVAAHEGIRVRAIGDSVTAGFGYYEDGSLMELEDLFVCKPSESNDDACSSNSSNRENMAPLAFAPDYGLSNNVSWAAQWANEYGVSDYKNLAVSGSEPSNWLPGGSLYELTEEVEAEDPDYILMTIGANPLLTDLLLGSTTWAARSGPTSSKTSPNAWRKTSPKSTCARTSKRSTGSCWKTPRRRSTSPATTSRSPRSHSPTAPTRSRRWTAC